MIRFDNGAVLSIETSFSLNTRRTPERLGCSVQRGVKLDSGIEMYSK